MTQYARDTYPNQSRLSGLPEKPDSNPNFKKIRVHLPPLCSGHANWLRSLCVVVKKSLKIRPFQDDSGLVTARRLVRLVHA